MGLDRFEWDEKKNRINKEKHKISFDEAARIFLYPRARKPYKVPRDFGEVRYQILGRITEEGTIVILVVCTVRGRRVRIISARRAIKKERELYYEHCKKKS